ncbi:MAG: hypothetical protein AB7S86_19135 [Hydrogenophaga sp.]|uniref:hypothetical protein n=1 Tax=Hydrogenophaga sp. TaxID=1904254 RepID=UPI003D14AE46
MNTHRQRPRAPQRGWSLLESAMVLLLVGAMSTGVWKTLELVGKNQAGEHSHDVLQRAEDALYGMALRDLQLPMPEDATVSPDRPNHWVGWLPQDVLGTEPRRSIRYIVDADLVTPIGALRFQADPMQLISNPLPPAAPLLAPRGAANGLDLCFKLIQRESSAAGEVNGMGLAFGVQQIDQVEPLNAAGPRFDFGQAPAAQAETRNELKTRTQGHLEMVHRMGCIQGFARLTTEVKSAAVFNDLHTVARINMDLKGLEHQAARDFLRSHEWRRRVAMTNLTVANLKVITNLIAMSTTPAGLVLGAGNVAPHALLIALWAQLIELSDIGVAANAAALPGLEAAHQNARTYANDLAVQRDHHMARANDFQARGVRP